MLDGRWIFYEKLLQEWIFSVLDCFWVEHFSGNCFIYHHHNCCKMKIFSLPTRSIHLYLVSYYSIELLYVMTSLFTFSSRNAVFARKLVLQLDVLHPDVNEVIISHVDFRENVFSNLLAILRKLINYWIWKMNIREKWKWIWVSQ